MNTMTGAGSFEESEDEQLTEKYMDVFRTEVPKGLPPSCQSIMRLKQNPIRNHQITRSIDNLLLNFELRRNILSAF
jgi:hypothetical protein